MNSALLQTVVNAVNANRERERLQSQVADAAEHPVFIVVSGPGGGIEQFQFVSFGDEPEATAETDTMGVEEHEIEVTEQTEVYATGYRFGFDDGRKVGREEGREEGIKVGFEDGQKALLALPHIADLSNPHVAYAATVGPLDSLLAVAQDDPNLYGPARDLIITWLIGRGAKSQIDRLHEFTNLAVQQMVDKMKTDDLDDQARAAVEGER